MSKAGKSSAWCTVTARLFELKSYSSCATNNNKVRALHYWLVSNTSYHSPCIEVFLASARSACSRLHPALRHSPSTPPYPAVPKQWANEFFLQRHRMETHVPSPYTRNRAAART